jgi:hypothetical protein
LTISISKLQSEILKETEEILESVHKFKSVIPQLQNVPRENREKRKEIHENNFKLLEPQLKKVCFFVLTLKDGKNEKFQRRAC